MTRMIVTIAPPTPNGDLHLGHLSGPLLSADVFTRLQRQAGTEVLFVCYSDDYQSYVVRKASEQGRDPHELASTNANAIEESLAAAGVELDLFMRADGNPRYAKAVSMFYARAAAGGFIDSKPDVVPYCEHCELYGYEAFARGACNHCGAASDPSQCENCARAPEAALMRGLVCMRCKQPLGSRSVDRQFLHLGPFRERLQRLHAEGDVRPWLRGFVDEVLAADELDWGVSRPHEAGVDIECDGPQRIHTWFSGIAGYYAACEELAERRGTPQLMQRFWHSPDTRLVHFLGFDCAFSHAIVYPALLSLLPNRPERVRVLTNAFLKLNGADFSTSRGHAVWIREMLREVTPDALRLYLASVAPEQESSNFDVQVFRRWNTDSFEPTLGRLRTLAAAERGQRRLSAEAIVAAAGESLASWSSGAAAATFSMRLMAQSLFGMLARLRGAVELGAPISALLAAYAAMGSAIHPALSASLFSLLDVRPELALAAVSPPRGASPEIVTRADARVGASLSPSNPS